MEKITRFNKNLLTWVTGKDEDREAWYLLLLDKDKELQFFIDLRDVQTTGKTFDLVNYGQILESCYGKDATEFYKTQIEKLGTDPEIIKAQEFEKSKEFEKAHQIYDEILQEYPEYDYCIACKAWSYDQEEKYQKAIAFYDQAIELRPGHMPYRKEKVFVLHDAKKYDQAIKEYLYVLEIRGKKLDKTALNNLVAAYFEVKEYQKAIEQGLILIEKDSKYANVHRHVARSYLRLGNKDKFKEHIDQAININPQYLAALMDRGINLDQKDDIKRALQIQKDFDVIQYYLKENDLDEKEFSLQFKEEISKSQEKEEEKYEQKDEIQKCALCFSDLDSKVIVFDPANQLPDNSRVMLKCGHDLFHFACIRDACNNKKVCPICRKNI